MDLVHCKKASSHLANFINQNIHDNDLKVMISYCMLIKFSCFEI